MQGVRTPTKNDKNIGFLSNSSPDPLKNKHLMLGHHRHASEAPFKCRFADDSSLTVIFGFSIPSSTTKKT